MLAFDNYDVTQLVANRAACMNPVLKNVFLTETKISNLLAFFDTLNGPCV